MTRPTVISLASILATLFAPTVVHAQGLGLPGPGGCFEDELEPNPFSTPTPLTESAQLDLNICASDDWFSIELVPGQVATFGLDFDHGDGDIDMTLQTEDFIRIDISEGSSNHESIRYAATAPTTVLLRVYGYGGATNAYTMSFELDDYSRDCPTRPPARLSVDHLVTGRLCLGQRAEWELHIQDDEPVELTLVSDPSLGDLDLRVVDRAGRSLGASESVGRWERLRIFPSRDTHAQVVVEGVGLGFGDFGLSVVALRADAPPLVVTGRVRFERLVPTERGLKGHAVVPASGALVELVRNIDDHPVARAVVDEAGGYELRVESTPASQLRLRVSARLETAQYRLRVVPTAGDDAAHHLDSEPLSTYPAPDGHLQLDVSIPADETLAGALNIAVTSRRALERVAEEARGRSLSAVFVWDRGRSHACGSCYSDGLILLAGGRRDTDEFDDAVILHELGHFVVDHLSWDDSPGGSHDGSRTNPLVAFGEGIATAFALLMLGEPMYVDTGLSGVRAFEDLERVPFPEAYGTSNGDLGGRVSEWTTSAIVWDLVDPESDAEPFDRIAISLRHLLRFAFNHQTDRRRPDLGAPGMELADFLDTFRCANPALASALDQLARGHQQFPLPRYEKQKCEWSAPR